MAPFPPHNINLRCGRVPSKRPDGGDLWNPGFFKRELDSLVPNVEYVEGEENTFLSRGEVQCRKVEAAIILQRQLSIHSVRAEVMTCSEDTNGSFEMEIEKNDRHVHFDDNLNTVWLFAAPEYEFESDDESSTSSSDEEAWAEIGYAWMVKPKNSSRHGFPRDCSTSPFGRQVSTPRVGRGRSPSPKDIWSTSPPKTTRPLGNGVQYSSYDALTSLSDARTTSNLSSENEEHVSTPGTSFTGRSTLLQTPDQRRISAPSLRSLFLPIRPQSGAASLYPNNDNIPMDGEISLEPKSKRWSWHAIVPKCFRPAAGSSETERITESWALHHPGQDEEPCRSTKKNKDRKGLVNLGHDVLDRLRRHRSSSVGR